MVSPAISIRLKHHADEECEYGEVTKVEADIMLSTSESKSSSSGGSSGGKRKKKIGNIEAILVDRQRIPERYFYSAFDGYSADLQLIGCALMEPRLGRTKLKSLAEWDDPEFNFMFILYFHVDQEYKQQNGSTSESSVAAHALREFLHHPFIRGDLDDDEMWKVSSVAYVLDPLEAMSDEEKEDYELYLSECEELENANILGETIEPSKKKALAKARVKWNARLDELAREDANPFLRNGFFQDRAIAECGSSEARILVASCGHFRKQLISHKEAVAVKFFKPPPDIQAPTGIDEELFDYLKTSCSGWEYEKNQEKFLKEMRQKVQKLLQSGASVARSHGLHVACMNNCYDVVKMLSEWEPAAINGYDGFHWTPLMVAANSAAGRCNDDGIQDTRVLDYLLSHGADKNLQDRDGLTAYGHFEKARVEYEIMLRSMTGKAISGTTSHGGKARTPSERKVQEKLLPPTGPSSNDLTGGKKFGIMDYTAIDRELDESKRSDGDY